MHIYVLNLIINGLPSIRKKQGAKQEALKRFKPYYKWITFNTSDEGSKDNTEDKF